MNISPGYALFRGEIRRKERETRTPGRQIKKEICEKFGLRPNQVKVNWGKGTAQHHLRIKIADEIYEEIGEQVEEFAHESEQWGFTFFDSDYNDSRHPAVSVANFDGLQRIWTPSIQEPTPTPTPCQHERTATLASQFLQSIYGDAAECWWDERFGGEFEVDFAINGDWHSFFFEKDLPFMEIVTKAVNKIEAVKRRILTPVDWPTQGF